jgi:D-glycero-D-manno-heptose 1,7-bisphosphate phosphatase
MNSRFKNRAVFLDRDGTLIKTDIVNGLPRAIRKINQMELMSGVIEGCELLLSYGYLLFIITNQPDVWNGTNSRENVTEVNSYLEKKLGISESYVCFHSSEVFCDCRKPNPGLVYRASDDFSLDLNQSWFIGDRPKDVETAHLAKCRGAVWLKTNYSEGSPKFGCLRADNFLTACMLVVNNGIMLERNSD